MTTLDKASAYSPTPWIVGVSKDDCWPWPVFRLREMKDTDVDGEEVRANALLIAAAPDLLDVCKRLRDDPNMDDMTAIQLLNEVIAKAEGSSLLPS